MSYASWVTPNKVSGSGDDSVSWTGSPHTGRTARTTTATFDASGVTPVTLTINQAGKTEFVDIDDTASVSKDGGTLTITGTSNSSKLTFALTGGNDIGLVLPASYIANSVTTNNGAAITGDPGAIQQYTFSITFTGIGANTCTITQAANAPYLSVSPTTINLDASGTAVSVSVSSNTSWTIS